MAPSSCPRLRSGTAMSDVGLDGAERLQMLWTLRDGFEVLRA